MPRINVFKLAVIACGILLPMFAWAHRQSDFTLIDPNDYHDIVMDTRHEIQSLLSRLTAKRTLSANQQIAWITQQLLDIPYLKTNAMGEGDWQPRATTYRGGAIHLNQNPVYRLDGLNCQTFVQIVMALYYANNLNQFDRTLLKIAYGAAGNPEGEIVHYFNRNHFIEGDFNPINQRNGWLSDVMNDSELMPYTRRLTVTLTRQKWFSRQALNPEEIVQVLSAENGSMMVKRLTTVYTHLNFPKFDSETITLRYIPKEHLVIRQANGSFKPNQPLLDQLPTPSILEIVRDPNRWEEFGMKVKDMIGSELSISHLGLLYRQRFQKNERIYFKTTCDWDDRHRKVCAVKPIICEKSYCDELMYAHATDAYPRGYYWYETAPGQPVCTPRPPAPGKAYTFCNRVVTMPLYDYLTDYQLGGYWNMALRSLLGVHVERLSITPR